eukprot:SAG31_NODE_991_length_10522_cov_5.662862_3_plen_78_part_00
MFPVANFMIVTISLYLSDRSHIARRKYPYLKTGQDLVTGLRHLSGRVTQVEIQRIVGPNVGFGQSSGMLLARVVASQ